MWKTSWMVLMAVPTLCPIVALAGETESASAGPGATQVKLAGPLYTLPQLPASAVQTDVDFARRHGPITAPYFRDDSLLARISKVRNLSLLTLSQTRRTRLYLGVNADGLVGLHFVAFSKLGEKRFLSVARLPHVKNQAP